MHLNENKCYPNLSYDLLIDISADYMNSLFDIPQTGNNNVDDRLFDSCSQYINTSNIHDIAINHNFTNQFLGMSVNMRSLVNTANFTKLEALIFSLPRKPDIIAITETWITPLNSSPYNNLDNYILVQNPRKNLKGGGVAFYIKNNLQFTVIDELSIMNEKVFESIFVKIELKHDTITCGTIYRSPMTDSNSNQQFISNLSSVISHLKPNTKCFICGDFNYDLLQAENKYTSKFIETMFDHCFYSMINKPTRITSSSATVLDHVWTNIYSYVIKAKIPLHPISDHLPLIKCFEAYQHKNIHNSKIRIFNPENINNFHNTLDSTFDTEIVLRESDPNLAYELFINHYYKVFDPCFPLTNPRPKTHSNNWFDKDLQVLMYEKEKLFKKYVNKKTLTAKVKYNKARNLYYHTIQQKKKLHYSSLFDKLKNNLKQTWKTLNKLLGRKKSKITQCPSLIIDGKLCTDSNLLANYFNDYFSSIGEKLVNKLATPQKQFSEFLGSPICNSMFLNPTSVTEIKKIISKMQPKNSTGIEEIPISVVKSSSDYILFGLCHIFNLSLSQGQFIIDFKKAKVIPVHKKGQKTNVNNYRPISLLPVLSKILEKIVYNRLCSFLLQSNFFYDLQFGFLKNHSTSHAAAVMVENITKSFKDKEYTLGVFLDLSKAFDTIDHSILLAKLNHFGVRGVANEWFRSYLNGRLMQTEVNGKISNSKPIEVGVQQGSILGPLLFLIYINDFPKCLTSGKAIMFADDTNLFFNSSSYKALYEVTNTQLKHVEAWLSANKLTLNTDKTLYVAFRTPNSLPPPAALSIQFKNKHLKRVNSCKFLGLTINEHLSWKPHMQWLLQKLRCSYHVINKVKQYLDKSSLLTLYHSLINSYVQYCVISWCHGNASMIQKLQKVSTKAINLINTKQKNSNVFQQHNLLTIQ